jgi:hypothetical protein
VTRGKDEREDDDDFFFVTHLMFYFFGISSLASLVVTTESRDPAFPRPRARRAFEGDATPPPLTPW